MLCYALLFTVDETDVPWNTAATTVERIREQSGLSLTERLRREFGVDASESDDEAKNDGECNFQNRDKGVVVDPKLTMRTSATHYSEHKG